MVTSLHMLLISILSGLVVIAYLTLFERNLIGGSQSRMGPIKVGPVGLLQPVSDALKLLFKYRLLRIKGNRLSIIISPTWALILAVFAWGVLPICQSSSFYPHGLFLIIVISRLTVYPTLLAGWASNSKYGIVGALRGVAQTISYEVRMVFCVLCSCFFFSHINIYYILNTGIMVSFIVPWLIIIWLIIILAETNRTPFDLVEGERELVRGFNTEYSGTGFTLLFMSEYLHIIILRVLTCLLFTGGYPCISLSIIVVFVFSRATLPRIRIDQLIILAWVRLLPVRICTLPLCARVALITSLWWAPPIRDAYFGNVISFRIFTWAYLWNVITCARFNTWHIIPGGEFVSPWDTWWYNEFRLWIIMLNKTPRFQCELYVNATYYPMPYLIIVVMSALFLRGALLLIQIISWLYLEPLADSSRPFECGLNPMRSSRVPFSLRFFILAVLFIIFDVELVLLMPVLWASCYSFIYFSVSFLLFIIIVIMGLMYEWFDGSLSWVNIFCSSLKKTAYLYYSNKISSTFYAFIFSYGFYFTVYCYHQRRNNNSLSNNRNGIAWIITLN